MGKPTGFKEIARELPTRREARTRLLDWNEVYHEFPKDKLRQQGARCMDCGIPFCHNGCPLGNIIPEWNDLVYKDRWKDALAMLLKTNNFPEFTGRVCPAPCEEACVLSINDRPVTIKLIEQNIIEHAWNEGWIKPQTPPAPTNKRVAVIGSGPAGLAAAAQLNQAGHKVVVFERDDRIGGLLTYGIPEFKLEKRVVDRRIDLMRAEGIEFRTGVNVGVDVSMADMQAQFDAIVLCGGATDARDLKVPGRELKGIYRAMEYLPLANRRALGEQVPDDRFITAQDKHVVILGGGDTGADCLGTALRQGAKSVQQFELLPRPPESRSDDALKEGTLQPWPYWPMIYRSSSAHEEAVAVAGADIRDFAINTESFSGDEQGNVRKLNGVRLNWTRNADNGRFEMKKVDGSEFTLDCDLCLLAMGFTGPEKPGPISQLKVDLDPRGNVKVDANYMTSVPGVFAAGDLRRGQSLVVWAISEGRQAARGVDLFLMNRTELPYLKLF